jgi:hypothetical protein
LVTAIVKGGSSDDGDEAKAAAPAA